MRSASIALLLWSTAAITSSNAAIVSIGGSGQTSTTSLFLDFALTGESEELSVTVSLSDGLFLVNGSSNRVSGTTYTTDGGYYASPGNQVFFHVDSAPSIDLAVAENWVGADKAGLSVSIGDQVVFGWRWRPSVESPYFYGWTVMEYGSLTHIQTIANNTPGGGITFSPIPEPSGVTLAAIPALSLIFRRRRKRAD